MEIEALLLLHTRVAIAMEIEALLLHTDLVLQMYMANTVVAFSHAQI